MSGQTPETYSLYPQQKLLWRSRSDVGQAQNAGVAVRIRGQVDGPALAAALNAVVDRHPILRTSFPTLPGTTIPVQRVLPGSPIELDYRDLRDYRAEELENALDGLFDGVLAAPFDLAAGPFVRAEVARLADDDQLLILCQPALSADQLSSWNLAREMHAALELPGSDVEPPLQFAAVAQWQDEVLGSEQAPAGFAHWRAIEGVGDARLQLEQPAPVDNTRMVAERAMALPLELTRAVGEAAEAGGVSRGAVLLAAWRVLLSRHADQADLSIGLVSSGRLYDELDDVIGPLQKCLPVRFSVEPADRFAEVLARADTAEEQALDYHDFYDADRLGSAPALVPPAFAFEIVSVTEPVLNGAISFSLCRSQSGAEGFKLRLSVHAVADGETVRLAYDAARFEAGYIDALLDEYCALLAAGCRSPQAAVGELDAVGSAQRERLLCEFARVAGETPAEPPLHELIAAAAAPDVAAVVSQGAELSYGELDRRSNQLARHLQSSGVTPGGFVGIYLDATIEMVVSILAVLKAGGAYLPLPPDYPRERLEFMLQDTAACAVVTIEQHSGGLPASGARVVVLDRESAVIEQCKCGPLTPVAGPDDPAYVIYTSGSTGVPKGVIVLHRNLAHSIGARAIYYSRPVGGYLLLSSFAFDSSIPGIFWTLSNGGRLVLPPADFERDLAGLGALIAHHRVTHLLALPTLYSVLLDHAEPGQLETLTTVMIAGESSTREVLDKHFAALPNTELHNEYGPTEGTVWSTVFDCSIPCARPLVPIGRPIPGVSVYILDDRGEPCQIGVAGELYVGGAGVTPGYHQRPELTAERFVDNPFGKGRLYRTGDTVRFLPDGLIEFLGRRDRQVKIRGYRIELEEVENALRAHPAIRESAVIAHASASGDLRMIGYVTAAAGQAADAGVLRQFVAESIPHYMVPSAVVVLDDLPRLPNGKVDRNALPAPAAVAPENGNDAVAPRTAVERVICAIWADVLGLECVSIHDDFFELGGHSILATQLFARLDEHFEIDVPLRAIFDHRTVAGLCERLLDDPHELARIEKIAQELEGEIADA